MSFGLQINNAAGATLLDTSSVVARIVATIDVSAGASGNQTDARFNGCLVLAVPLTNGSSTMSDCYYAHRVSISGSTVSWSPMSNINAPSAASRIFIIKRML